MGISGGVAEGEGIAVQISASIQGLLSGMKESAAAVNAGTKEMEGAFEELGAIIKTALGPLLLFTAALEGLHVFEQAIENTTELAVQLEVLHQKTGIAVEQLSALKYVAELSHVSFDQVGIALQRLARNMEEAAKGGISPAVQAFHSLGIAVEDSNGHLRPMGDVLFQVADRFHNMEDGAKKTALAIDIFGRSGANMIPMLNLGREKIQELEEEAKRLGVVLSQDNVNAVLQYHDSLVQLHAAWGGLVLALSTSVMPVLDGLARFLTAVVDILRALGNVLIGIINLLTFQWKDAWSRGTAAVERMKDAWTAISTIPDPVPGGKVGGDNPTTPLTKQLTAMQKWEQQLREMHEKVHTDQYTVENNDIIFWKNILDTLTRGTEEYNAVYDKWAAANKKNQDTHDEYNKAHAERQVKNLEQSGDLKGALALAQKQAKQVSKLYGNISKESEGALAKVDAIREQIAKQWIGAFESIHSAFTNTITKLRQTGGTFRDFMRGIFQNMADAFAASQVKMLEAHAAMWLARKGITAQGVVETVALEAWSALKVVAMKAAEAAAGAWAAIASIPYVGPFLAPAAAAATLAGVLALAGNIHSAAGGYDIPAGINPITQLHAQEMVLPKKYANVIRGMAGGSGGGGGDVHLHVHTVDAGGVRQFMMKHKDAVAGAAYAAAKSGVGYRDQPGRRG